MAKFLSVIGLVFVAALALAAPTPTQNIVQLAAGIPGLSTLVTALKAGQLTTALSGPGPFTVFAPTNEAFAALPPATLASLLKPANIKQLDAILEYHVISGAAVRAEDLKASQDVKTLEGQEVHINKISGSVTVQNAKVIQADVGATNGVVHVIDGVLTPPTVVHFINGVLLPPAVVPLEVESTGACTADDATKVDTPAFSCNAVSCAKKNFFKSAATGACLAKESQITQACGACFGQVSSCTLTNCALQCLSDPAAAKCQTCAHKNCDALANSCTGLAVLPPNPSENCGSAVAAVVTTPIEYVHFPLPGGFSCSQLPASWTNRTGWATPKEAYDRQQCSVGIDNFPLPSADKQWLPGTCASAGKEYESGEEPGTSKDPAQGCTVWTPIEYVHFPAPGGYCSQLPASWTNRTGWATPKEAYDRQECSVCCDGDPTCPSADKQWLPGTCASAGKEYEAGWGGSSKNPNQGCTQWCHAQLLAAAKLKSKATATL